MKLTPRRKYILLAIAALYLVLQGRECYENYLFEPHPKVVETTLRKCCSDQYRPEDFHLSTPPKVTRRLFSDSDWHYTYTNPDASIVLELIIESDGDTFFLPPRNN